MRGIIPFIVAWMVLSTEEQPAVAYLLDTTGKTRGKDMQSYRHSRESGNPEGLAARQSTPVQPRKP